MEHEIIELDRRLSVAERGMTEIKGYLEMIVHQLSKDVAENKEDVKVLKKHDEEFSRAVYDSCDAKTKEIDDKIEKATEKIQKEFALRLNTLAEVHDRRIKQVAGYLGTLTLLGLGAVIYFNNHNGIIHEKINRVNEPVVENRTDIKRILHGLDKIDTKIDNIIKHTHPKR